MLNCAGDLGLGSFESTLGIHWLYPVCGFQRKPMLMNLERVLDPNPTGPRIPCKQLKLSATKGDRCSMDGLPLTAPEAVLKLRPGGKVFEVSVNVSAPVPPVTATVWL
jgi:hypothetical protein